MSKDDMLIDQKLDLGAELIIRKKRDMFVDEELIYRRNRIHNEEPEQENGQGFVLKLLSQLSNEENSVISPYGIATVLSMAAEGANESSLNEILKGLGFASLDELRAAVLHAIKNPSDAFKSENAVGCIGVALRKSFKKKMTELYAAAVSEETGEVAVTLSNRATFKAQWLVEMERDDSGSQCFRNVDGTLGRPAFLSCSDDLRYYRDDTFDPTVQAVGLPYKLDGRGVPYELILVDSEKPLTQKMLQDILSNMRTDQCEVKFPEFSVKCTYNLIPMMKTLGIGQIFNQAYSPLDRVATEPLYAAAFSQEAEIQVDQNGTIAKAITAMMLCTKGGFGSERFFFYRPFIYFLRNTNTGEILFEGKVNKL